MKEENTKNNNNWTKQFVLQAKIFFYVLLIQETKQKIQIYVKSFFSKY